MRIELPPEVADRALAGHDGLTVDYAANLWWRSSSDRAGGVRASTAPPDAHSALRSR